MSRIINQNTEPLFIFDMPDDHLLSETISVKGEKGEKGDPTKLSELDNDTGFITASTSALTNYYSKTATDNLLDAKLDKTTFNALEMPSDFFTADDTVSGTGSSIALANTAESVIKNVTLNGDATQDGTPTPDNPVDIDIVTGEQTIAITGTSTQTYVIELGNIELCAIGDAKDYIFKAGSKWYKHAAIEKTSLKTDAIDWNRQSTGTSGNYRFCVKVSQDDVPYMADSNATPTTIISNYFKAGSRSNTYARQEKIALAGSASSSTYLTFNMYIDSIKAGSVDDFKTWLQNNEVIVYYVSTTPSDTEITDLALIAQLNALASASTYLGTTTVAVSGDLPSPLSIEAFKNGWGGTVSGIDNELDTKADKHELAQRAYYCDSVAKMKKANLELGSCAVTTGYYAYDDGGGAQYRIVSDNTLTDDGATVHALDNGLKAVMLINDNTINVKQFGAKGDGTTDDTAAIQKALAWNGNNASRVIFERGATFIAQGQIYIYSNTDIDLNGATLKDANGVTVSTSVNNLEFLNNVASLTTAGYGAIANFNVHDGTLDGNTGGVMFCLLHAQDCRFENIDFNNAFAATHVFDLGGCKDITIKNCNFIGCLMSVADNAYREVIQPDYATYAGLPYWGNDESYAFDGLPTDGLTVEGCVFKKNDSDTYYLNGVGTHSANTDPHNNIVVKNCKFYGCEFSNIRLPKAQNVLVEGNTFYGMRNDRTGDNFAINIYHTSTATDAALKNITIKDNKYISVLEQDDQIFIKVVGNSNYLTNNVMITGNEYNGVAVAEGDYVGNDFSQLWGSDSVTMSDNIVRRAKQIIYKNSGGSLSNLTIKNNVFDKCLRYIRAQPTDTTPTVNGLSSDDNIWINSLGTTNTSRFRAELTFSEDVSLAANTYTTLIPSATNNPMFETTESGTILIPTYIRRAKISGYLAVKSDNGGKVSRVQVRAWDRTNSVFSDNSNNCYKGDISELTTLPIQSLAIYDNDLRMGWTNTETAGRFGFATRVYTADADAVIDHTLSKIIIEGW